MESIKKISDINETIGFGKHFGKTIKEILELDSQYIIWVHDNAIKGIRFSQEIMTKAIQKSRPFEPREDDLPF